MKQLFLKTCIPFISAMLIIYAGYGQTIQYRVSNAHAHNDYEHNIPFTQAYNLGFGSIEADVILKNDSLFVGHSAGDIVKRPLFFEQDYIQPLQDALFKQKDSSRKVILLIDLKTEALSSLKKVIEIIEKHPMLTKTTAVQFVITGNQPPPSAFDQYPPYIYFDGNINNPAHIQQIARIGIFSDNFRKYSGWSGKGNIPQKEKDTLTAVIQKVHELHKKIRFWGCPDNTHAWQTFMDLQVDYINTDHIQKLADFLNKKK